MVKYCYKCGHTLSPDSLFCEKCGTLVRKNSPQKMVLKPTKPLTEKSQVSSVVRNCDRCGNELLIDDLFCKKCGARVKKPSPQQTVSKSAGLVTEPLNSVEEETLQPMVVEPEYMMGDPLKSVVEELTQPEAVESKSVDQPSKTVTEESDSVGGELSPLAEVETTKPVNEELKSPGEKTPKVEIEESKSMKEESQKSDVKESSEYGRVESKPIEPESTQPNVVQPKEPSAAKHCNRCGYALLPRSSFCRKCGAPVNKSPPPQTVSKPPTLVMDKLADVTPKEPVKPSLTQYCYRCGNKVSINTSFCKNCGSPVRKPHHSNNASRSPNSPSERGRRQHQTPQASSSPHPNTS